MGVEDSREGEVGSWSGLDDRVLRRGGLDEYAGPCVSQQLTGYGLFGEDLMMVLFHVSQQLTGYGLSGEDLMMNPSICSWTSSLLQPSSETCSAEFFL